MSGRSGLVTKRLAVIAGIIGAVIVGVAAAGALSRLPGDRLAGATAQSIEDPIRSLVGRPDHEVGAHALEYARVRRMTQPGELPEVALVRRELISEVVEKSDAS